MVLVIFCYMIYFACTSSNDFVIRLLFSRALSGRAPCLKCSELGLKISVNRVCAHYLWSENFKYKLSRCGSSGGAVMVAVAVVKCYNERRNVLRQENAD